MNSARPSWLGKLEVIPDGDAGTRVTLEKMVRLARDGAREPLIVATAHAIVRNSGAVPGTLAAVRAVFNWVRDSIAYKADPNVLLHGRTMSVELLSEPAKTLAKRHEDCDGKATLLASLLYALRYPIEIAFRAIKVPGRRPHEFSHVYTVARVGGVEIPMDPTYRGTAFGWQYGPRLAVMEAAL